MKSFPINPWVLLLADGGIILTLMAVGNPELPEPLPTVRILLGIAFVLLGPGYALQAAFFPRDSDLDSLARLGFSFGLSVAVLPPIFLILTVLGVGLGIWPVAAALGGWISIWAAVAFFRRRRLMEGGSSTAGTVPEIGKWWMSQDRASRWMHALLVVALITAAVSAVWVSRESPGGKYTEFYFLDDEGLSEDYPRRVATGEPVAVQLAIVNHEGEWCQYKVIVVRGEEKALADSGPISLADGEAWQGKVTIMLTDIGTGQEIEFLLERTGAPWPYRSLRIWIDVLPAGELSTDPTEPIAVRLPWGRSPSSARNPAYEGQGAENDEMMDRRRLGCPALFTQSYPAERGQKE